MYTAGMNISELPNTAPPVRFSIQQVAESTCLSVDTARHSGRTHLLDAMHRDAAGRTCYMLDDVSWRALLKLMRDTRISTAKTHAFAGLMRPGKDAAPHQRAGMKRIRPRYRRGSSSCAPT